MMSRWLEKLQARQREQEPARKKPRIHVEPDPNMAPGVWQWSCLDCSAGNTGPDQQMRAESMEHCANFGHPVRGNALE